MTLNRSLDLASLLPLPAPKCFGRPFQCNRPAFRQVQDQ
jgi:hypothetical protein